MANLRLRSPDPASSPTPRRGEGADAETEQREGGAPAAERKEARLHLRILPRTTTLTSSLAIAGSGKEERGVDGAWWPELTTTREGQQWREVAMSPTVEIK
jgi:hypothetical protein